MTLRKSVLFSIELRHIAMATVWELLNRSPEEPTRTWTISMKTVRGTKEAAFEILCVPILVERV
jgi:hypothetical protein